MLCEERLLLLDALTDASADLASATMELRVSHNRAADLAKLKADKARAKLIKHTEQHGCGEIGHRTNRKYRISRMAQSGRGML